MKIGIDFDNTLVCFDELFYRAAMEKKLIPAFLPTSKEQVRDYLRKQKKEDLWTELQGYVYGVLIKDAPAFEGVDEFMKVLELEPEYSDYLGNPHNNIGQQTSSAFF